MAFTLVSLDLDDWTRGVEDPAQPGTVVRVDLDAKRADVRAAVDVLERECNRELASPVKR